MKVPGVCGCQSETLLQKQHNTALWNRFHVISSRAPDRRAERVRCAGQVATSTGYRFPIHRAFVPARQLWAGGVSHPFTPPGYFKSLKFSSNQTNYWFYFFADVKMCKFMCKF